MMVYIFLVTSSTDLIAASNTLDCCSMSDLASIPEEYCFVFSILTVIPSCFAF